MPHSVDPKQTTRAFAYEFWMKAPNPMVTFIKTIDVTRLVRISKRERLKFNMLLDYCIGNLYVLPLRLEHPRIPNEVYRRARKAVPRQGHHRCRSLQLLQPAGRVAAEQLINTSTKRKPPLASSCFLSFDQSPRRPLHLAVHAAQNKDVE